MRVWVADPRIPASHNLAQLVAKKESQKINKGSAFGDGGFRFPNKICVAIIFSNIFPEFSVRLKKRLFVLLEVLLLSKKLVFE